MLLRLLELLLLVRPVFSLPISQTLKLVSLQLNRDELDPDKAHMRSPESSDLGETDLEPGAEL